MNIVKTHISERTECEDTVPLFQIIFLEGGGRGIFRGSVEGVAILLISFQEELNTVSPPPLKRFSNISYWMKGRGGV